MTNEDRSGENPAVRGAAVTGFLVAGALYYMYRRSRSTAAGQVIAARPTQQGGALIQRGQQVLENTLDQLSAQAMAEVKVILKRGLHHLETMVDDL